MVATGILAAISGIAARGALREGMTAVVPAHRADRIEKNLAAVECGFSFAEERHLVPAGHR
jgi:Pyruvate/2-oxoacid:ferredoxin oxidoreductase gamma subunit